MTVPATRSPGQQLFAAIVDALEVRLPPSLIAVAVRNGKPSLDAGVEPRIVLLGCLISVRRGHPELAARIIGDIVLAEAGQLVSGYEYRRELNALQAASNPAMQRIGAHYASR